MSDGTVFVYGTLTAHEVVKVLLHRIPERRAASIKGYTRHKIQQQVFPAIKPAAPADIVHGYVLMGLDQREMHILDEYEDSDYYRTKETATLEDNSTVEADVYVWKEEKRSLLVEQDWDYDHFRKQHLAAYLNMSEEFLEELVASEHTMNGWRQ